jgi:hypothetical protein
VCLSALFFVTVTLLAGNHLSGDLRGKYDAARIAARAVKSASEVGTQTNVPSSMVAFRWPISVIAPRRGSECAANPLSARNHSRVILLSNMIRS